MYVVTYTGLKDNRAIIRHHEFSYKSDPFTLTNKPSKFRSNHVPKFDVLLTSYEMSTLELPVISSINWAVLVIDEAHRLKSSQSLVRLSSIQAYHPFLNTFSQYFQTMSKLKIDYKLLLTGTPLQNNLEELFNLLNFLEPQDFW